MNVSMAVRGQALSFTAGNAGLTGAWKAQWSALRAFGAAGVVSAARDWNAPLTKAESARATIAAPNPVARTVLRRAPPPRGRSLLWPRSWFIVFTLTEPRLC